MVHSPQSGVSVKLESMFKESTESEVLQEWVTCFLGWGIIAPEAGI